MTYKLESVPLLRGPLQHGVAYSTTVTGAGHKIKYSQKAAPCLTLPGEVWDVYCEDIRENTLFYNDTIPYCAPHELGILWAFCLYLLL